MKTTDYENIVMHYYTTKVAALLAGFDSADAQQIARFAQFVGDNIQEDKMAVTNLVEEMLENRAEYEEKGIISPLANQMYEVKKKPSGIRATDWFSDDRLKELTVQSDILIPYHYFPPQDLVRDHIKEYRTAESSDAFQPVMDEVSSVNSASPNCAAIGICCHVIADMYLHQLFSGVKSSYNHAQLDRVNTDDENSTDITDSYEPEVYGAHQQLVGINQINRVLHDSGIKFHFQVSDPVYAWIDRTYRNKVQFLKAANKIYNFLLKCKNKNSTEMDYSSFESQYGDAFQTAFATMETELTAISAHWKQAFNGRFSIQNLDFGYDETKMMDYFRTNPDDYCHFVVQLEEVTNAVYPEDE